MPNIEVELNPVDFITVGTVGPKGQRVFHLQGAQENRLISLTIEKQQALGLGEAIRELLSDLDERFPSEQNNDEAVVDDLDLRDPIEPMFRVAQMGLGYDESRDMVVLVVQELMLNTNADDDTIEPGVIRMWCSREQIRALADRALMLVQSGRPNPRQNGRIVYYWT